MAVSFSTVILLKDEEHNINIFLRQFARVAETATDLIHQGVDVPAFTERDSVLLTLGEVFNAFRTDNQRSPFIVKALGEGLYGIGVHSSRANIRSLIKFCWPDSVILIEDSSSYKSPKFVELGSSTIESDIPGEWNGDFDHSDWIQANLSKIKESLSPVKTKSPSSSTSF
jgi:hypothetical protein